MNNNYLSKDNNIKNYNQKSSYIVQQESFSFIDYTILPEQYSVFTELENDLFIKNDTVRDKLIAQCLCYLKEQLINIFRKYGVLCVLPKMTVSHDEEDTIIISWSYTNFRIYFSFDDEKNNYQSYCGIVLQEDEESFSSQSKRITFDNYKSIIDRVLSIVINNS